MKLFLVVTLMFGALLFADLNEEIEKIDAIHNQNLYENELVELEKLNLEFPNEIEILWRLAQVHFDIADQTEDKEIHKTYFYPGFEFAKKALELNQNSAKANHWYAVLIGKIGILEGTKQKIINSYQVEIYGLRALELDPIYDGTLHLMGQWHYKLADLSWAERKIASLIFAKPPKASFAEAADYFQKAIVAKPDEVRHYLWLGKSYLKLKNKEEAIKYLQMSIEMMPIDDADKLMQKEAKELLK
ncbi:MAG: hypothetical protein HN952_03885 [Candidatus Cloacimonetes bacterium]|jgi:tetratricopeptide (TPR) repeat protein|nr:hypothetical protein [Candidatus Cloacimonadota bacterium]MBT6994077.1 hypothetical protein [Candidatus Cloacimonadota bacterium]MBT7469596.1 hypothetical protein [Candidatus Cloacimonadota bacterium]